jgi:hypothetical protein
MRSYSNKVEGAKPYYVCNKREGSSERKQTKSLYTLDQ